MSEDVVVRLPADDHAKMRGPAVDVFLRVGRDGKYAVCKETEAAADLGDLDTWLAFLVVTDSCCNLIDPAGVDAAFEMMKKAEGVARDAVGAGGEEK